MSRPRDCYKRLSTLLLAFIPTYLKVFEYSFSLNAVKCSHIRSANSFVHWWSYVNKVFPSWSRNICNNIISLHCFLNKMGPWSSWTSCVAVNGYCGAGTQFQTRSVVTRPYCSAACPSTRQTRSCTHSCCPRNCVVSSWTGWGACSSTCGTGRFLKCTCAWWFRLKLGWNYFVCCSKPCLQL